MIIIRVSFGGNILVMIIIRVSFGVGGGGGGGGRWHSTPLARVLAPLEFICQYTHHNDPECCSKHVQCCPHNLSNTTFAPPPRHIL